MFLKRFNLELGCSVSFCFYKLVGSGLEVGDGMVNCTVTLKHSSITLETLNYAWKQNDMCSENDKHYYQLSHTFALFVQKYCFFSTSWWWKSVF